MIPVDTDTKLKVPRKGKKGGIKKQNFAEKLNSIGTSPDKTPKEREQDKRFRQERGRKRDEGEDVLLFRGKNISEVLVGPNTLEDGCCRRWDFQRFSVTAE